MKILSALLAVLLMFGLFGCAAAGTGSTSPEATYQPTGGGDDPGQDPSPEATYQPTGKGDDPANDPSPEATQTGAPAETTGRISEEAAWQIALEHAGLTRDQVTGSRIEFEYDDGRPEYKVEFYHDRTEYEYEIHAETGKILSYERDK